MKTHYYCTPEGYSQLVVQQDELKEKRNELIKIMSEATKGSGEDLSENNEYLQAKEEIDRAEVKLLELGKKISNAEVIDITKIPENGKVIFGSTVELFDVDTEEKFVYKIVGIDESNIKEGKISLESPIAKALIGNLEGEEVDVITPTKERILEIIKIKHI